MILKILFFVFIGVFAYFSHVSKSFNNPYKLVMIFGKKGSGKNTLLTKLSIKYNKLGYTVFSDSQIFNTYKLEPNWITKYDFPHNSVIMIEEAGIIWDNRNFKAFSNEFRDFFKLQRHHHVIVYLCSQSFDIDKKLRDLTDEMYLCTNIMGIFSIAKRINKKITIHKNNDDSGNDDSFLTESYSFGFPWEHIYTYIPRYIPFFNSFHVVKKGIDIPKLRYEFLNENELFKLQTNKYYYKINAQKFLLSKKEKIQDYFNSFKVDNFCIWSNFGILR